ncbi:MAG: aminopeptidase P family protein [Lentisphaerae bacterium]|nr:aminopeptidase P family protein [Lentisphaerota bacterium]MCP4101160.1 aminopeptidase P family protein [Lentisphaerota bacterium]
MKPADLIYAASEHNADMLYATGFRAPDAFIYFKTNSETGMVMSALEQDRAAKEAKTGINIYSTSEFANDKSAKMLDIISGLAKNKKIKVFRVPANFPLGLADQLRGAGYKVSPEEKKFFPEREFKNSQEVDKVTAALRITENGMRRAHTMLQESDIDKTGQLIWNGKILTSEILRAEINIELIRGGAMPDATIVACGTDGADPHNLGSGPIEANKTIIIDIFPRVTDTGYWGDLTRTFVKGTAPDLVKRAYDAVFAAREHAKPLIKAGAVPSEIHNAAKAVLDKHGFETGRKDNNNYGFFHGLGHGVGLEIHEAPRLSPANNIPLQGGEIATVEPGVYYQEWGGIRLEDMVAVESNGCRCLTEIENILEVK